MFFFKIEGVIFLSGGTFSPNILTDMSHIYMYMYCQVRQCSFQRVCVARPCARVPVRGGPGPPPGPELGTGPGRKPEARAGTWAQSLAAWAVPGQCGRARTREIPPMGAPRIVTRPALGADDVG